MKKFLQAAAFGLLKSYVAVVPELGCCILLYLLFYSTYGRYVALAYIAWIILDRHTPERGGRSWNAFRWWVVHKYGSEYFPVTLHKTADLPETENYILGCVPHGVLPLGQICSQSTYNGLFKKMFPHLNVRFCILGQLFWQPITRDIFLWGGHIASSEKSIKYFLKTPKSGATLAMCIGGSREAILTKRGQYKLYMKKRTGIFRVALQTGAHLVPVITFGENDTYDVSFQFISEETFWNLLEKKSWDLGLLCVLFLRMNGDGLFGFLPRRVPLNVVYGTPLPVQKTENPTNEEILHLRDVFMENLTNLFEQEKHKYIENASEAHLEFV